MSTDNIFKQIATLRQRLATRPEARTPAAHVERLELENELRQLEAQAATMVAAQ